MHKKFVIVGVIAIFCIVVWVRLVIKYNDPVDEITSEIEWISLSFDENYEVKEAIRVYEKKAFEVIKTVKNKEAEDVPIAIGFYDLNHDGTDEILAFISDTEFHGAKDSGGLYVYAYDGKTILGYRGIAGFSLDNSRLDDENSKQIGILYQEKGWDNLYINNRIWETEIELN